MVGSSRSNAFVYIYKQYKCMELEWYEFFNCFLFFFIMSRRVMLMYDNELKITYFLRSYCINCDVNLKIRSIENWEKCILENNISIKSISIYRGNFIKYVFKLKNLHFRHTLMVHCCLLIQRARRTIRKYPLLYVCMSFIFLSYTSSFSPTSLRISCTWT